MSGRMSRNKGKAGERELRYLLVIPLHKRTDDELKPLIEAWKGNRNERNCTGH